MKTLIASTLTFAFVSFSATAGAAKEDLAAKCGDLADAIYKKHEAIEDFDAAIYTPAEQEAKESEEAFFSNPKNEAVKGAYLYATRVHAELYNVFASLLVEEDNLKDELAECLTN